MSSRKRLTAAPVSAAKAKTRRTKESAEPPAEDHQAASCTPGAANGRPKRGGVASAAGASPRPVQVQPPVEPLLPTPLPSRSPSPSRLVAPPRRAATSASEVRTASARSQTQRTADRDGIVVYLMRHGTSEWNLLKKWQGATDTQLAPQGVTQARDAGMTLSLAGVAFETAVCSDLRRAHHTCELLLQACGVRGCKARPDPRLRECSLGEFEGQTKDQIYGERYVGLWARLAGLPHEARLRTPYFAGLETPKQVGLRAAVAVAEVAAEAHALGAGGPLLAVTHSTVLEAFLATLFGADFDSVETETLAWLKLRVVPYRLGPTVGWRLVIEDSRGIAWRRSPDALVLDSTAAAFAGAAPGFVLSNGGASGAARSPWMPRVLVGSLLMAVAGVLRILATGGKVGGNAEAVDVASYWGPVTGSIDWCEANYAVHPRIAEFANSLTSLFFVAAGLHVAAAARRAGAEVRYQLLGVCLALVGVGSSAFHATLRKQEQALDEIPMLWLATLAAYCVFQGGRAANKPSTATAATTHAPGAYLPPLPEASPLPPPHGSWLPVLLLAWCGVATAAQWRVSSGWQPLAFHLGFASAEAVFLRGAWLQKRRAKDPRTKAVLDRAFALYALAIGTWALDNAFCQALRRVSSSVTWGWVAYPQLHAWGWHGVMSLASALMILGGTAERLELLASAPGHRAWLQPSPRFGFFWPTLRHANTATRPALK